jgi:hypothetical protein
VSSIKKISPKTFGPHCVYTCVIFTFNLFEHPIHSLQIENNIFQRTSTANSVPLHSTYHTLLQYNRYTTEFAAVSQGCCHVTVSIKKHILLARDQVSEGARKLPIFLRRLCHHPCNYHCKATHAPLLRNTTRAHNPVWKCQGARPNGRYRCGTEYGIKMELGRMGVYWLDLNKKDWRTAGNKCMDILITISS